MATAILELDGHDFRLGVFGEPEALVPALRDIVTDERGSGRAFDSPAHLAHDVLNGLAKRGYRPVRESDDDGYEADCFYHFYTAPNGQALVNYEGDSESYNGRVKTFPVYYG